MNPWNLLLVEDSPDDCALILRALQRDGRSVQSRRVFTEADLRAALQDPTLDAVLSDYRMPELDAVRALQILHESGRDLPFIVVSGSVGEEIAVRMMKSGAHDFFPKDRLQRLGAAVDREIREAAERAARRRVEGERAALLENLEAAVAARDEFLSVAAHELRTPLTTLRVQLELALREASVPTVRQRLERSLGQLDRLTALVITLVDVSAQTGTAELDVADVDLAAIARDAVALTEPAQQRSGARVELDAPGPVRVRADRRRIESVIWNLLANALKFGGSDPVQVRVWTEGGAALLSVADHGIGISPEDQARIFERFERAVPARHYGGLGMGLWVARRIVEAHGGTVTVSSAPGQGSRFVVRLPAS
jgi:signal transduction histidine kinase